MTPFPKRFTAKHISKRSIFRPRPEKLSAGLWISLIIDDKQRQIVIDHILSKTGRAFISPWNDDPATTLDEIADELNAAFDAAGIER